MAKNIFVTATNTSIGKTYSTLLLMKEAAKLGIRPAAFKPIETGVENGIPSDGTLLYEATKSLNPDAKHLGLKDIVPITFKLPAAPFVAKGDSKIDFNMLVDKMRNIQKFCDILFIEGAGGLLVPVEEDFFIIDMPRLFKAHTLLITPSKLGSINDTLLSMEAMEKRGLSFTMAVNLFEEIDSFETITRPYYLEAKIEHFLLPNEAQMLIKKLLKVQGASNI